MASFGSKEFWEQWYINSNNSNSSNTSNSDSNNDNGSTTNSENSNSNSNSEWYLSYAQLEPIVNEVIGKEEKVLMVGCGNSLLSLHMSEKGWQNLVNVDFSAAVIDYMKRTHDTTAVPGVVYVEADVCELQKNEVW